MERQVKEKMNLSFAPDIKEYLQVKSELYGMSVSAYLTMLVCNHRKEDSALESMQNMGGLMERMEALLKENEKNIKSPSEIKEPTQK